MTKPFTSDEEFHTPVRPLDVQEGREWFPLEAEDKLMFRVLWKANMQKKALRDDNNIFEGVEDDD